MKTLLAILLLPLFASAAQQTFTWDATPLTAGLTNYSLLVATNSRLAGNTNWFVRAVGTNRTATVEIEGPTTLYAHVRAQYSDGTWAESQNEVAFESPKQWQANVRAVAVEATFDIAGTNWIQAGYFRLRFLP